MPKSGEVWCEGARLLLRRGEFGDARRCLEYALHFTPQYGDTFIEYLRLLTACSAPASRNSAALSLNSSAGVPNSEWLSEVIRTAPPCLNGAMSVAALNLIAAPSAASTAAAASSAATSGQQQQQLLQLLSHRVEQMCIHADPNYGSLWLLHRDGALSTAKSVLRSVRQCLERARVWECKDYGEAALSARMPEVGPGAPLSALRHEQRLQVVWCGEFHSLRL